MNREMQQIFVLWVTTVTLMTATSGLRVILEPKNVVKEVQESLELVCRALDCPKATFVWRTPSDTTLRGTMTSNKTTSTKTFSQLTTEDENIVICRVTCGRDTKESTTKINVFSFPSNPVFSRVNDTTLECTVHSVYPHDQFTLHWLSGVSEQKGSVDYRPGSQDVSSMYTPSEEDLGKNITCRGTLSLSGTREGQRVRSVSAQYGPAFINVTRNTTVRFGQHLELRCDADGQSNITWKKLGKGEGTIVSREKVIVVENVTWSDAGEYECEARTGLGSRRSGVAVTVVGPPNVPKIRISQASNPRPGDNVTIFCYLDDGSLGRLAISGASLEKVEKQSSSVAVNITSIQLKDSGLYYCDAQNEFGSRRSSVNIKVQGAPPRNSTVMVQPSQQVMEAENITINCTTVSFPPASVTLRRESDGVKLKSQNGIFYFIDVKSEDAGMYTANFTNELGYEVQTFELVVTGCPSIMGVLPKAIVPTVGSVSLLTAAALLLRHLRRVKRGSSDLPLDEAL